MEPAPATAANALIGSSNQPERGNGGANGSGSALASLRDSNVLGIIVADGTTILQANDAFLSMLDYSRAELERGEIRWREISPDDRAPHDEASIEELLATGAGQPFEKTLAGKEGSLVPVLIGAVQVDRSPMQAICYVVDLSSRRRLDTREGEELLRREQLARAEAEQASERLRLVSGVSELLAVSLDYPATFQRLARRVVQSLADLCLIDVVDKHGSISRVAAVHRDPTRQHIADRLRDDFPPEPGGAHPVARVVRTARPEHAATMPDGFLAHTSRDGEHHALVRDLGLQSFVCVPLSARGRTLGALTLISTDPARRYGHDDVVLAEEIARRAAVRIDNARLYGARDRVAQVLQRGLLPPALPSVDWLTIAPYYRPGGSGYDVGGDFYDAFANGDGTYMLVIGDVCGKGPDVAAMTGLARHTIRAAARYDGRPSGVLRALNRAFLEEVGENRFCTVAAARLHRAGRAVRATVALGGHPAPLVVRADGGIEATGRPGTLLGAFQDPLVHDVALDLGPGDSIFLYTDGLVGGRELFEVESLLDELSTRAGTHPDTFVDAVARHVGSLPATEGNDDVAVLVASVSRLADDQG